MVKENWWWSGVKEARGNLQDISYIGHRCYQNLKEDPSMTLSLKSFKMDRWTKEICQETKGEQTYSGANIF